MSYYKEEVEFSLDLSPTSIKDMMKEMKMPYPIFQNALKITLTVKNLPDIMSKEELDVLIKSTRESMVGTNIDKFTVENCEFSCIKNCVRMSDKEVQESLAK